MKQRVIHVMTHDSIGLGEDGPTHQPVEHLAALRAIPNCFVMRPCGAIETAECWEAALDRQDGPSILVLTRQGLPCVRQAGTENLSRYGAYILAEASAEPKAVLIATGSEVEIALQARDRLESSGIPTRVVSAPCLELFALQNQGYQAAVLGPSTARRVAVEAALRFGWDRGIGQDGTFIGMRGFGDSAPADVLFKHFDITADAIVKAVNGRP
jgi:transketolase